MGEFVPALYWRLVSHRQWGSGCPHGAAGVLTPSQLRVCCIVILSHLSELRYDPWHVRYGPSGRESG